MRLVASPLLFVFALLSAAVGACGRTTLDDQGAGTPVKTEGGAGGAGGRADAGGSGGRLGLPIVDGGLVIPPVVPCGDSVCIAGLQSCCLRLAGDGGSNAMCIPATATCDDGVLSVSCFDGTLCGAGRVCCLSLSPPGTSCGQPDRCLAGRGTILCSKDSQCPATLPHCCPGNPIGICQAAGC